MQQDTYYTTMAIWMRSNSCLRQQAPTLECFPEQFSSVGGTNANWLRFDGPQTYQCALNVFPPPHRDPWTSVRLEDFYGNMTEQDIRIFQRLWEDHRQESLTQWPQLQNKDLEESHLQKSRTDSFLQQNQGLGHRQESITEYSEYTHRQNLKQEGRLQEPLTELSHQQHHKQECHLQEPPTEWSQQQHHEQEGHLQEPLTEWSQQQHQELEGHLQEPLPDWSQQQHHEQEGHRHESQTEWSQQNRCEKGHQSYKYDNMNSDIASDWNLGCQSHCDVDVSPQCSTTSQLYLNAGQHELNAEAEWTYIDSSFPETYAQEDEANKTTPTGAEYQEEVPEKHDLSFRNHTPGTNNYPLWETAATPNSNEGYVSSYWPNENQEYQQWECQQGGQLLANPQFYYSSNSQPPQEQDFELEPGPYHQGVSMSSIQQRNQLQYQHSCLYSAAQQNSYLQSEIVTSSSGFLSREVDSRDGQSVSCTVDSGHSTYSYSEQSSSDSNSMYSTEESCSSQSSWLSSQGEASPGEHELNPDAPHPNEEVFPTIDFAALAELGFITAGRPKLRSEQRLEPENTTISPALNGKNPAYTCPVTGCGQSFLVNEDYRKHLGSHSGDLNFECNICHMRFYRCIELSSHVKQHLDSKPKPYKCPDCEERFSAKYHVTTHRRRIHSEGPGLIFKCEICEKIFSTKAGLERHVVSHTSSSSLPCEFCDSVFKHPGALTRHYNIHHTTKEVRPSSRNKRQL